MPVPVWHERQAGTRLYAEKFEAYAKKYSLSH